jgi:hypothetical protein
LDRPGASPTCRVAIFFGCCMTRSVEDATAIGREPIARGIRIDHLDNKNVSRSSGWSMAAMMYCPLGRPRIHDRHRYRAAVPLTSRSSDAVIPDA